MDESELIKTGMEVALRPVTEIAENLLGLAGGDWISEKRARNRAKLKAKTEEILKQRGVEQPEDPPPSVIVPLLTNAQEEDRDELVDLWARLLAAAMDPSRKRHYRREFVDIVRKMEPLDAAILPLLNDNTAMTPTRREVVASRLQVSSDEVLLAFRNLEQLDLVSPYMSPASQKVHPVTKPLGRELLMTTRG